MGALLIAAIGFVPLSRLATSAAGRAIAVMALTAFAGGQLLLARPTIIEAIGFSAAAFVLDASRALRSSRPGAAAALLVLPAALVVLMRPGVPTPALIADVLFCSQHGALATSAILWLGAVGVAMAAGTGVRRAGAIAASLVLVVAAAAGGHRPSAPWRESVGAFSPALPHLALGLVWLAVWLRTIAARQPGWAAALLLAPILIWNLTLVAVAHAGTLRIGEAVSFGAIGPAQARVLHGWTGHVFSMPASLAFAVRYGTSPARFDEIGAADDDPSRPVRIDVGSDDGTFVGAGWFAPERAGDLSFRWAGRRADLLLPPLGPGRVRVRLRTYAFGYPGAPEQRLEARIDDARGGPVSIGSDWAWVELEIDLRRRTPPATPLTLEFGRATAPSAVQASQDGRALSAAVDLVEVVPVR